MTVDHATWGFKRICPAPLAKSDAKSKTDSEICATLFYDKNANPIVCPKCAYTLTEHDLVFLNSDISLNTSATANIADSEKTDDDEDAGDDEIFIPAAGETIIPEDLRNTTSDGDTND